MDDFQKERDDIRAKMLEFSRAMSEGKSVDEALFADDERDVLAARFNKNAAKRGKNEIYLKEDLIDVKLEEKKSLASAILSKFTRKKKPKISKNSAKTQPPNLSKNSPSNSSENLAKIQPTLKPQGNAQSIINSAPSEDTSTILERRKSKIDRKTLLESTYKESPPQKQSVVKLNRNFTQSEVNLADLKSSNSRENSALNARNSAVNLDRNSQNLSVNLNARNSQNSAVNLSNLNSNANLNARNSGVNLNARNLALNSQNSSANLNAQNSSQSPANPSLRLQNQAANFSKNRQISAQNLQNLQSHESPANQPFADKNDDELPEIRLDKDGMYVKTTLLQGHEDALNKSANLGLNQLLFAALCIGVALIACVPKVYITSNIYYLSRDIATLRTQESVLSEENKDLNKKLETLRFKNQILDYLK